MLYDVVIYCPSSSYLRDRYSSDCWRWYWRGDDHVGFMAYLAALFAIYRIFGGRKRHRRFKLLKRERNLFVKRYGYASKSGADLTTASGQQRASFRLRARSVGGLLRPYQQRP